MKEQLAQELEKIGLSEKEARVYLASLELGSSTAQTIAAKATVNRPTTYIMIESLIKRGLMSSFEKGKKRYFVAAPPRQLMYIINQQKHEISEKEKIVSSILSTLSSISGDLQNKPSVSMYEGIDGIRAIQEDIMNTNARDLFELVSVDEVKKFLPPIYDGDIRERILDKYKIKSLYVHKQGPTIVDHKNVESRFLPDKHHDILGDVILYGSKTSLISYNNNDPISIIINDSNLTATFVTMFLSLWNQGEIYAK